MVFAPDQGTRLAKLKKGDLASEAERLAAGTCWLPAMLCKAEVKVDQGAGAASNESPQDTGDEHDAEADAAA